jgi:hypothetical protein
LVEAAGAVYKMAVQRSRERPGVVNSEGSTQVTDRFDYAQAWKPGPGDVLRGTVTEITEYHGGGYGSYPILTVTLDEDCRANGTEHKAGSELAIHAFHTVLRNELARLDVQIDESIAVLYGGRQRTRDGSTNYEGYRVKTPGRQPQRFNWGNGDGDPTGADDLLRLNDESPAPATRSEPDVPF